MFSRSQNFRFIVRITAAILLLVIAWGSTVEATHGHAAADTNLNAPAARNCIELSTESLPRTSVQQNEPTRSSSRSNTPAECLICQLHHNLATTLLAQPATLDSPNVDAVRSFTVNPLHVLEFTTAQPGRAPPII